MSEEDYRRGWHDAIAHAALTGRGEIPEAPRAVPLAPTDADVEHLRRAMVEAHQTYAALDDYPEDDTEGLEHETWRARDAFVAARRAYVAAKRARGGM